MAVFTETILLKDEVSGPAKKAAGEVEGLAGTMSKLGLSTLAGASAMKVGEATIGAAMSGIGDAFRALAAGDVKGAVAGVTDAVAGLAKALDLVVPGLGQAVSAVVQLAGGLVGITAGLVVAGAKFAISSSEAKDASLAMFEALGQCAISGEKVDDMLDDLRESTGLTKDSLGTMTKAFLTMGVTGEDALRGLTTAAASAEALGKGGAEAFTKLYQQADAAAQTGSKLTIPYKKLQNQLVGMGLNVDDLAKQMGVSGEALTASLKAGTVDAKAFGNALEDAVTSKGVGPMKALANSSANLGKLLQEYIGDLFEDLGKDIGPFMAEVKSLFEIFNSKTKPSGQALKSGIGGFFKEVFATAAKVVPLVKHFLLDVIIFGLKAYIALKPLVKSVKDFFASAEGSAALSAVLTGIGTALAIVAGAVAVVIAVGAVLIATVIAITVAFWTALAAISQFTVDAMGALQEWIGGAATAASDFVAGLVAGLTSGAGMVVDAVKGLASSATSAFTDALGISSPSKVMMQLGGHTGAGFAEGLEATAPDVHGAASGVASAAVSGASSAPGGASGGGSSGGGGVTVNVEPGAIVIQGAGKGAEELTEEAISLVFERVALESGL